MKINGVRIWDLRGCKEVAIPEGTERIENYWFCDSGIESASLPASVRKIGSGAFCGCKNLKKVVFDEGCRLETIGDSAFCCCVNLTKISLPECVEKISVCAFTNSGLESIEFPASLRTVARASFAMCRNLRTA